MADSDKRLSTCSVRVRLIASCTGVIVGLAVFTVFTFHYENYNAGLWGLLSGLAAAVALGVTIAYMKNFWESNPRQLKLFMLSGCFIQLAGVCGLVAYLVLAISNNQGLIIYGPGYYLTCVWCVMTWKWGLSLLMFSRSFLRSYLATGHLIQNEETYQTKSGYHSVGDGKC